MDPSLKNWTEVVLSLCHMMLSLLQFCRAIKYWCVFYVDVVCWLGAEGVLHSLEHIPWPNICRWKTHLANQHRGEGGRQTLKWSNKNCALFDWNVCFFHLPLLQKVQTMCNSSKEKQVIVAVRAWVHHHRGHSILYIWAKLDRSISFWNWIDMV